MKRSFTHFLVMSFSLIAMSGCVDPKVLVTLKDKVIETFNPGGPPAQGNSSNAILSANYSGFCLEDGTTDLCWGKSSFFGAVSPYAKEDTSYPAVESVLAGKTIKKMAMSSDVTCVIASDDKLYCWGDNASGAVGVGIGISSSYPLAVSTSGALNGKNIIDVSVDGHNVCAIDSSFHAYCWGSNSLGENGTGTVSGYNDLPVAVNSGSILFKEIKVSYQFTCALSTTNTVYCWGKNSYGQIGNGGTTNSALPSLVDLTSFGISSVKALGVSDHENCVIGSDDKVYCWGNLNGTALSPQLHDTGDLGSKTVKSMAVSATVVCVIASDDLGYCKGANSDGQLGIGSTTSSSTFKAIDPIGDLSSGFKEISMGTFRVCALSLTGKVYCWGYGGVGDGAAPVAGSFLSTLSPAAVDTSGVLNGKTLNKIVAGDQTVCAIDVAGEMYCWGPEGRRGDGVIGDFLINTPVSVMKTGGLAGKTFKEVQVGFYTTCALASDDQMYCWGAYRNNLGTSGATFDQLTPKRVLSDPLSNMDITNIVFKFKDRHGNTCIQRSNGDYYCIDFYSRKMIYFFSMGSEIFTKVAFSSNQNAYCGLSITKRIYCWGDSYGTFLNSDVDSSQTPIEINMTGVLAGKIIEDVFLGDYSFGCVLADGQLYCWGSNSAGQLGDGTFIDSKDPVTVSTAGVLSGKTIKRVETFEGTVCVIASDDRGYCWGQRLRLGNGATGDENLPSEILIPSGEKITKILMRDTVCALTDTGNLYCWGSGHDGVLGAGSGLSTQTPVKVNLPGNVLISDFSLSASFACAIGRDANAYCWGSGYNGEMGRGINTAFNLPGKVSTPSGVELQSIAAGVSSVCALSTDSKVYCWGQNDYSQLGNNSATDSNVPVEVQFTP